MGKSICRFFVLIMVAIFLCSNVVSAYSLDDVHKEYHRFKIKTKKINDDGGERVVRLGRLMTLYGRNIGEHAKITFYLREINSKEAPFLEKDVLARFEYSGDTFEYFDHLAINNSYRSVDVSPNFGGPKREPQPWGWPCHEWMTYRLSDKTTISPWLKAEDIKVMGSQHYEAFVINRNEYDAVMNVINKYLADGCIEWKK